MTNADRHPHKPTPTRIRVLTPFQVLPLYRLFVKAVRENFAYFPEKQQQVVIHNHNPVRLLRAAIDPRRIILTAQHDGELVGYAISAVPKDGHGQLFWLYVAPGRRGSNTGLALLSRTIRKQRQLGATEVALATYDHRHYYERQGFTWLEKRLVDGVEMDIMSFPLRADH